MMVKRAALLLAFAATPLPAAVVPPTIYTAGGQPLASGAVILIDPSGNYVSPSGAQGYTAPKGYQQLSNAQLATVQTLTVPAGAVRASVQNNGTQAVRFRNDGTAPTSTTGQRIPAGATVEFVGSLATLQFIQEASGTTLDVIYYG